MSPLVLFAISGFLMLIAVWFSHFDQPLIDRLNIDIAGPLFIVGILSGIAAWVMWFVLFGKHAPQWPLFYALAPSLAIISIITSWRLWEGQRWVPLLLGLAPCIAVAVWAMRGGLRGAAGVALWMPALAIVAGSAWYFSQWRDPRGQILISDMIDASGSAAAAALIIAAQSGQKKEELETQLFLQNAAGSLTRRHLIRVRFLCLLFLLALVLSALLWRVSPQFGLLGAVGAAIAVILPTAAYWRARKDRNLRTFLLGEGALVYDGLFVFALLFAAGQGAWVIFGG